MKCFPFNVAASRYAAIVCLAALNFCVLESPVAAEDRFLSSERQAAAAPKKKARRVQTRGFANLQLELRDICLAVELDGRRERLQALFSKTSNQTARCVYCKSFFRTFASACKLALLALGSSNRKKDLVEEPAGESKAEIEKPKARLPHIEVIDLMGALFHTFSEETRNPDEYVRLAQMFQLIVTEESDFTEAEKEYFRTLVAIVTASFGERMIDAPDPDAAASEFESPLRRNSREAVDAMFAF